MKPNFQITFVITGLLIVGALILPPWKNSFTGQFSGFHYLFSEAGLVKMLELDYARLGLIVLGIILTTVTVHIFLVVLHEKSLNNNSQHTIKKVHASVKRQTNFINDNYIIIKAIILLFLGIAVVMSY